MKFLHLIALASAALAAPNPMARQESVVGTVNSVVNTLEGAAQSNIGSITKGIDSLKGSADTGAAGQVQETLKTALKGITSELKKATDSITGITTGAAGGVATAVKGFGQDEIDQLGNALATANKIVGDLKSALDRASKELTPEVKKAVEGEISAAKKAIGPFVTPLTGLADAAKKVVGVNDVDTSKLDQAVGQIKGNLQAITGAVGLSGGASIAGGLNVKPVM